MHHGEPGILLQMAGEIGEWFRIYGIPYNAIEKLKHVKLGGRLPFLGISERWFRDYIHMAKRRASVWKAPQQATEDWIRALHACIKRPREHQEVLRQLPIPDEFLWQLFGAVQAGEQRAVQPAPQDAQYPPLRSNPQDLCNTAIKQADQGYPVPALDHLKSTFNAYLTGEDLESALAVVPALIYVTYRHFKIERVAQIATATRSALRGTSVSRCDGLVRRVAAMQLCTVLTEHGEGKRAEAIFKRVDVEDLVHDRTRLPWPKGQVMRTMAAHEALHNPDPRKADYWLSKAAEISDARNRRGIAAMRYTVAMQAAASQPTPDMQRKCFGTAWEEMTRYYQGSRKLLQSHVISGSHLNVCNDVYLGMLARHFSGTYYDRNEQREDIRALQWGLRVYGANKPQMEDELMRYPVHKLFEELGHERVGLIRMPFSKSRISSTCDDVIALIDVLLGMRSD